MKQERSRAPRCAGWDLLASSTSPTSGASPSGACPAPSSTTSRWRRGRDHHAGELPRVRAGDVAPALGRGDARVRSPTTVLGTTLDLPLVLAPVGSSRMFYPRGEEVAARAAGEAGTAYILSTLSGTRLEEVKAATKGPAWYQVYLVGGRDVPPSALRRARAAGFSAIVVTIDTPVSGLRERDVRNGVRGLVSRGLWSTLRARAWTRFSPALAGRLPRGWRPDELPQRRAARPGPHAVCRRGRGPRAVDGELGRSAVDSRRLAAPSSSRAFTRATSAPRH